MSRVFERRRDLSRFLAVVETGTVIAAADGLDMTQPALTRLVAQLETAAGALLFRRHPKGMALTPFGEIVAEEARQLVEQMDAAEARCQRTMEAMT